MPVDESNPRWVREVSLALSSSPHVILTGNVRDHHVVAADLRARLGAGADLARIDTLAALSAVLEGEGIPAVLVYDPVDGLRVLSSGGRTPAVEAVWDAIVSAAPEKLRGPLEAARGGGQGQTREDVETVLGWIVSFAASSDSHRMALVLDFASWVAPVSGDAHTGSDPTTQLPRLLRQSVKAASTARPVVVRETKTTAYNPVVWITRHQADLPSWLVTAQGMKLISIELPPARTRHDYGGEALLGWPGWRQIPAAGQEALIRQFASATEGLTLKDGLNIVNLALNLPDRPDSTPKDRLRAAERVFRIGVPESQWDDPGLIRFLVGEDDQPDAWERLNRIVTGQPAATRKAADVLTRSAVGLSGAENSGANPNRPKGVLFFAGPTGTGKTLLAKSIAAILNQDPANYDSYIRFDMSEYSAEHTEARLVGAPPGYVGYDAGGQLTEAVRQRPFSVLLFDEIEKADPRILDKFLQILDEGRLTDGTGVTVSFSETFIVFTSNLGVTSIERDAGGRLVTTPLYTYERWREANLARDGGGYAELQQKAARAIDDYFTLAIQRPELLNRIGRNNIVIFDYIGEDAAASIVDTAIEGVVNRMREKHTTVLTVSREARAEIHAAVRSPQYMEMGGRGLNAGVEAVLVNPLARAFALLVAERGGAPDEAVLTGIAPEPRLR